MRTSLRLDFLKSDRFWKWVLWVGIGIFLLTRLLTLMSFPVFNDEAIYLQYSQAIHEDFGKYKFISEGGLYADWKPPFQYWFGSIFFGIVDDPLFAGRLSALLISIFGFCGLYFFVKELFGKKEAALALLLYALCAPALFYNNQFVAETFVFSLAPWMYWAFLRGLRAIGSRPRGYWAGALYVLLGAAFGGMLLLSKQSGMVYALLSLLLPLAMFDPLPKNRRRDWRGLLIGFALVIAGIILALLARRVGVSAETAALEKQFNGNWLMTPAQIFALPWATWRINWESIRDYYAYQYSIFILLPLAYFFFAAIRRKDLKELSLAAGFVAASAAILLLLKGFNQYIYNTAVIVFLIPILVRTLLNSWTAATAIAGSTVGKYPRALAALVLVSFALLLGNWSYQIALIKFSPQKYILRSSPWMIANYLHNWSGGFGVAETIAYLKTQTGPGLILADPQWGNPRTTLEVYNPQYPSLRVVGLTGDFQTSEGTLAVRKFILEQPFKTRLVVFSSARNETRAVWQDNVQKYLCDQREEVQVAPLQPPIVICGF